MGGAITMNKKRNSILQRATLWGAALSLAGCMVAVPRAAAQDQDDQQITPSQSDSQSMQQPDYNNQQGTYSSQGTYNQGQQGTYNRDEQDRDYNRDQDRDDH